MINSRKLNDGGPPDKNKCKQAITCFTIIKIDEMESDASVETRIK